MKKFGFLSNTGLLSNLLSLSPMFFMFSFVSVFRKPPNYPLGILFLWLGIIDLMLFPFFIGYVKKQNQEKSIEIKSVNNANRKILYLLMIYIGIMPLLMIGKPNISFFVMVLFATALFSVVFYSTMPMLNLFIGIFGYRFYQIETSDNLKFLLISKKFLLDVKNVNKVIQLHPSVLLDAEE